MIVRRLVENLKQQHWTGVIIELAIVVLGVFIGLQVSTWNEARVERKRSAQVLDAFRIDMRDYSAVTRKFGRRANA